VFFATLRPLWRYRNFILGSVQREFQSKYKNTLLSSAWPILNPLAMVTVYTVIFSQIMQTKLPTVATTFGYSIYLCTGILVWALFSEITLRGQNMFSENANLLKKVEFPRICLPAIVVATGLLNFLIAFTIFTGFLIISDNFPGLVYLILMPIVLVLVLFAAGLGVILGVLNVFFRDVGYFFGIFITFWFWLTPIVYPASILSERVRSLTIWNPMNGILEAIQGVVMSGTWPHWEKLVYPSVVTVLFWWSGFWLFRRVSAEMLDEL